MKTQAITTIVTVLAVTGLGTFTAAAKKKKAPEVVLTETGQKLQAEYGSQFEALKAELTKALPAVKEEQKAGFLEARAAEVAAEAALKEAQNSMGDIKKGHGLVAHAKGKWIGGADKGIAAAKEEPVTITFTNPLRPQNHIS